ncbi:unnamed protein product [Spirodela intermedia]|uniref:Exostosin GT47 domain-containing protein n=1 Tax=Spirodela intermedia TaxID=51605 RepID=A0A7I8JI98_SPIIN|nr:unnamed protein product [Spirodela intermedia]CAA6669878.1 unnamed protein product [Spirodela intermedia]
MRGPAAAFLVLLLVFSLIAICLLFFPSSSPLSVQFSLNASPGGAQSSSRLKIYVAELPRSLNYGLLEKYWSLARCRLSDRGRPRRGSPLVSVPRLGFVGEWGKACVAAVSGEPADQAVQRGVLAAGRPRGVTDDEESVGGRRKEGGFGKKEGNDDYARQKEVVDLITSSDAWNRSGGRDHVFVLTDPVAMWHVRNEIAPAILLVVDFGGWFKLDDKTSDRGPSHMVQHNQVSLLKDVIVPYTHLLPKLSLSEDQPRNTLLYFKGAKHRHRGGLVREKLWDLLVDEPGVVIEEGFPNATGREQSIKGMRASEFCLHPAGDTPTSCRLFDAVLSLCIPVVISDQIELPFEGILDYSEFAIFVSVADALQQHWLVDHLRNFTDKQRHQFRRNMAQVQSVFEYDSGSARGVGPAPPGSAVEHIWKKVSQKVPIIREAVVRGRRKPNGVEIPLRCHCT